MGIGRKQREDLMEQEYQRLLEFLENSEIPLWMCSEYYAMQNPELYHGHNPRTGEVWPDKEPDEPTGED